MAGKNKSLRWARVYLEGVDLSGEVRSFGVLDRTGEDLPGWGISDAVYNFLGRGRTALGVQEVKALLNDVAGRSFDTLKAAGGNKQLMIAFGGGAEPTAGDPIYMLPGVQMNNQAVFESGVGAMQASFLVDRGQMGPNIQQAWGVLHQGAVSLGTTTNSPSFNHGAGTTLGGWGMLQVIVTSGGVWAFKIQHSPNDSAWADLITFTGNGSAIAAEVGSAGGNVDQYTRFVSTRTSGTVTIVGGFCRNTG